MHDTIKNLPTELNAQAPMAVSIQIAKFKFFQYQWRAISPNLMLAKVTRYTVQQNLCSAYTSANKPVHCKLQPKQGEGG